MKKQYFFILIGMLLTSGLWAQEFKLPKRTGQLNIQEVNNVKIEGYSGNEIVFSSSSFSKDKDDRAKGLRAISSIGLEDNTGLGLSVVETDGVIEVRQLKKMDGTSTTKGGAKCSARRVQSPIGSTNRLAPAEGRRG